MNPHFQPHSNPPYPQNNPGYPQTNLQYPQQAQPGPNKYPDLPPIQNPQHNQPYPQYQPHNGGAPGYIPPNQYGNIQERSIEGEDSEKTKLEAQMKELENKLNSGDLGCYIFWSYLILICSTPIFLFCFAAYVCDPNKSPGYLLTVGFTFWLIVQSYFAISADRNKSLFKANVACWFMSIYLICAVAIEGICILGVIKYIRHPYGFLAGIELYFFGISTIHLLAHIFINVRPAFKVRKILVERAEVDMKLVENFFSNNA